MKKIKSKPECEGDKHLDYFSKQYAFWKKLTFNQNSNMKGAFLTGQMGFTFYNLIFQ